MQDLLAFRPIANSWHLNSLAQHAQLQQAFLGAA